MAAIDDSKLTLRLWPGIAFAALFLLARFVYPVVSPGQAFYGFIASMAACLLTLLWWVFASRVPWVERLVAIALAALLVVAFRPLLHESIATGAMGFLYFILVVQALCMALVVGAVLGNGRPARGRRTAVAAALLVAAGGWLLVRTEGFTNAGDSTFAWRWSSTAEQEMLEAEEAEGTAAALSIATLTDEAEWPGFRGPLRDGKVAGVRIETDWEASPPVEIWRRAVGPGWSSFAVHGDVFFTQEQRGDEETVSAYRLSTGEPLWRHGDPVRFWESNAGAGPRGTPTLHEGRVYSFGATGILNALDEADGSIIWSADVAADTGIETPMWGFSSSPLIVDDLVIVAAVGKLAAYELATGEPRWFGPDGGDGYSSPHFVDLEGAPQVVLMSMDGALAIAPEDGDVIWKYEWKTGTRIVQPAILGDGEVLMSQGNTTGLRRVAISRSENLTASPELRGSSGWTTEERWTTNRLKPFFSDFVVHDGHAYGFDGNIMAAVDVETGERAWKGGRYGSGQLLLLEDQDVLLVVSEKGGLALVSATPEKFTELASLPAVEGKTWNHPVVVGDMLLLRNDREMVAFRLALEGR